MKTNQSFLFFSPPPLWGNGSKGVKKNRGGGGGLAQASYWACKVKISRLITPQNSSHTFRLHHKPGKQQRPCSPSPSGFRCLYLETPLLGRSLYAHVRTLSRETLERKSTTRVCSGKQRGPTGSSPHLSRCQPLSVEGGPSASIAGRSL